MIHDIKKVYWTINELSDRLNVATSKIRFYESEIKQIRPKKRGTYKNGHTGRKYNVNELLLTTKAIVLGNLGVSIKGIKRAFDMGYFDELYEFLVEKQRNGNGYLPKFNQKNYPLTIEDCYER